VMILPGGRRVEVDALVSAFGGGAQ
jgi:hypothetical protein